MLEKNDDAQFMDYLTSRVGTPDNVLIDRSHLAKSPLDAAKVLEEQFREWLANLYLVVVLVGVVCAAATLIVYGRKG
jgi:hypothetical protein